MLVTESVSHTIQNLTHYESTHPLSHHEVVMPAVDAAGAVLLHGSLVGGLDQKVGAALTHLQHTAQRSTAQHTHQVKGCFFYFVCK